tara:strand:- start:56 stop:1219 length:1164 start_codon:yes stop_codon:yes gene_type:complete
MCSKIIIAGNFSCANRGDLAILRGILNIIKEKDKRKIQIITRDIINARLFLGSKYDIIDEIDFTKSRNRIYRNLYRLYILLGLFTLSRKFFAEKDLYDKVYFVGGAYFIDTYGYGKLDLLASFLYRSKNVQLIGHSVGPFNSFLYKTVSKRLYKECSFIGIRDMVSLKCVKEKLKLKKNIHLIPDTAFAFIPDLLEKKIIPKIKPKSLTIAMTVRELSPFDKVLKISQEEYSKIFLDLAEFLLSKNVNIIVVSMCTPLNGYHKDDRSTAKDIFNSISNKNFRIIEEELSDLEIGEVFKGCDLVIGTRLHSCILSMAVGTPAIAVYYEHKSLGVYKKLKLSHLSKLIRELENHEEIYDLMQKTNTSEFNEKLRNIINIEHKFLNSLDL